ncbi:hypothetical protein ACWGOQ_0010985 [Aquimarina sp. M1]
MKKNKTQNISLKKLTIARISTGMMKKIEGGTSVFTETKPEPIEGHEDNANVCYEIK